MRYFLVIKHKLSMSDTYSTVCYIDAKDEIEAIKTFQKTIIEIRKKDRRALDFGISNKEFPTKKELL